jgi:guanine nucleotide-binding protein subunit alpha
MLDLLHPDFARVRTDSDSFFEHAKRIAASDYIPNEADVLRARTKTTGIYETRFTMGQLSIQYD